jgi:hypothetical protein
MFGGGGGWVVLKEDKESGNASVVNDLYSQDRFAYFAAAK